MGSPLAAEAESQLRREPSLSSQLFVAALRTPSISEAKFVPVPMSPISGAWPSPRSTSPASGSGFSQHVRRHCDRSRQGERDEHACHPREPQRGPISEFGPCGSSASQPHSKGRRQQVAVATPPWRGAVIDVGVVGSTTPVSVSAGLPKESDLGLRTDG
ncbi:hypothetical protein MTO96_010901 [Rhipicephalus appendiculatus]